MATWLGTWGAPGRKVFTTGFVRDPVLPPPGRTSLRTYGGPGRIQTFVSKSPAIVVPITSSDTVSVQWNEDPVNSNTITTQDTTRVTLTEVSQLFNQIITTDTASVTLSETVALVQQGVLAVTTSDTVSTTLASEISAVNVAIATTDTVSISVTDVSTLTTPAVFLSTADTVSVTLTETSLLGIFTGVLQFASQDDLSMSVDDIAELQMITPAKPAHIRIQPKSARIQIVPL